MAWAAVVFWVFMVATVAATAAVRSAAHADAEDRFQTSASQAEAAVEQEVTRYFRRLATVAAFVANAPDADAASFAGFVRGSQTFEQFPSITGVLYLERVEDADLPAFLARGKAGDPNFAFLELAPYAAGTTHYILRYYVPGPIDLKLPAGTDVTSITSVTNVLEAKSRTGGGAIGSFQHDPVLQRFARETRFPGLQTLLGLDFFIGVPAYPPGQPPDGAARAAPLGWVAAPVARFQDVVNAATRGQPDDLGLSARVDLTDAGLGHRDELSQVALREGNAGARTEAAFQQTRTFAVEGVDVEVAVWSTPDADNMPLTVPLLFVGGTVAAFLAAAVIYLRLRTRDRERALAIEVADQAQFRSDIVDSVTDAMVVLDAEGRIVAANPAWESMRRARDEAADLGRPYLEVLTTALRAGGPDLAAGVEQVLAGASEQVQVDVAAEQGGTRRWFAARATPLRGRRGGAVVVHTDITDRKRSHDELELRASHDDLTGLLNRSSLEQEIDRALLRARVDQSAVAVIFVDLDGFKQINDTYGHAAGDDVLRTVAQRIAGAVRTTDRVARLGGDEFVVLISPLTDPAVASTTGRRILDSLSRPAHIGDLQVPLGASVGVAVADSPLAGSAENLLDLADRAMYEAKHGGGGHLKVVT